MIFHLLKGFPLLLIILPVLKCGSYPPPLPSFTDRISFLTCSCYFHVMRRMRAIRRSITCIVFATIIHALICSRIDYCNSILRFSLSLDTPLFNQSEMLLPAVADPGHLVRGRSICFTFSESSSGISYESLTNSCIAKAIGLYSEFELRCWCWYDLKS